MSSRSNVFFVVLLDIADMVLRLVLRFVASLVVVDSEKEAGNVPTMRPSGNFLDAYLRPFGFKIDSKLLK